MHWFKRAADQGDPGALTFLARFALLSGRYADAKAMLMKPPLRATGGRYSTSDIYTIEASEFPVIASEQESISIRQRPTATYSVNALSRCNC